MRPAFWVLLTVFVLAGFGWAWLAYTNEQAAADRRYREMLAAKGLEVTAPPLRDDEEVTIVAGQLGMIPRRVRLELTGGAVTGTVESGRKREALALTREQVQRILDVAASQDFWELPGRVGRSHRPDEGWRTVYIRRGDQSHVIALWNEWDAAKEHRLAQRGLRVWNAVRELGPDSWQTHLWRHPRQ